MAPKLKDGAHVRVKLRHGTSEREHTGKMRSFEQDGSTRWELVLDEGDEEFFGPGKTHERIGVVPDNVISTDNI
jgi:hypothetical protein